MSGTVTVRIPTALRPQAGDQGSVAVAGASVKEALSSLTSQYPELGRRLFQSNGTDLNRFINVYVNDEDIRFLNNLDTPLNPGDELSIIPAIAGG
jgi:molybdopterin converting factor small subunit